MYNMYRMVVCIICIAWIYCTVKWQSYSVFMCMCTLDSLWLIFCSLWWGPLKQTHSKPAILLASPLHYSQHLPHLPQLCLRLWLERPLLCRCPWQLTLCGSPLSFARCGSCVGCPSSERGMTATRGDGRRRWEQRHTWEETGGKVARWVRFSDS